MTALIFSNWELPDAPGEGALSFDASTDQAPQPAVWRLDLPAEPQAALQALAELDERSQASSAVLDELPERIERLASQGTPGGATSFAVGPSTDLPSSDAELLRFLNDLDRPPDQASFGLGDDLRAGWGAAQEQFQKMTSQALQSLSHMAWVETSQGGLLFGRTAVGWTGDMDTFYTRGTGPEQIQLHQRSLSLALTARHAFIRAFSATVAGASRLALSLATPGGALLALPAVWKYVNQILSEVERVKTQSQGV